MEHERRIKRHDVVLLLLRLHRLGLTVTDFICTRADYFSQLKDLHPALNGSHTGVPQCVLELAELQHLMASATDIILVASTQLVFQAGHKCAVRRDAGHVAGADKLNRPDTGIQAATADVVIEARVGFRPTDLKLSAKIPKFA
jgi:hypothetical protein